ncbi:MAG: UDP-2,4-diacetamido-2,4,6-trideoxy-beta-L-altropyranose hydrolase, partial [Clostridiales bacterium]|nr:UDP-2,4-diacetamido-2,4,6-trideoxy-beta-L-altropyranose hydrolase [Clostridiales bacterium]
TGHVMRCLAIAFGIKDYQEKCLFITADENAKQIVERQGFQAICLNSKWDELDQELESLIKIVDIFNIDKLIIDSYCVSPNYLEQLNSYIKVIYIDDLNSYLYPCSMLINYNIYHDLFPYSEMYKEKNTKLLLGCDYAPLRKEFQVTRPLIQEKVKKILITTGGTDHYNVAGKLLKKIIDKDLFNSIEFHVVVGQLNKNYECLNRLSQKRNSIILHKNVKRMAELMMNCDIAITAGGSTMYELCACGVPSICFSFADNQLYGVKAFEEQDLMDYAGDIRYCEDECISKLILYIDELCNNQEKRKERSANMRRQVDGYGVERIVKAILEL